VIRHLFLLLPSLLLPTGLIAAGSLFDPFSEFDDYLHQRSDLKSSDGDISFFADFGYRSDPRGEGIQVVVMISIPESEFLFHKTDEGMVSNYRVSIYWKELGTGVSDEKTWDRHFVQSQGSDMVGTLHTFRTELSLMQSRYKVEIGIDDLNAHRYGHVSEELDILNLLGKPPALSSIFFLSPGTEWPDIDCPDLSVEKIEWQPLGLHPYGAGNVRYLVEIYRGNQREGDRVVLEVDILDPRGAVKWSGRKTLSDLKDRCPVFGEAGTAGLGLGEYRLSASLLDSDGQSLARQEKPFYISSSEGWLKDHFETAVGYLQPIASQAEMDRFRSASPEDRLALWGEFWRERDPFPATPLNEGLVEYFGRLSYANRNFTTHIEESWKTDRGRVYLSLGPPDERIIRESAGVFGTWEIWIYDRSLGFKTILYFEDRGFTGDFRLLNPNEYLQAKSRLD